MKKYLGIIAIVALSLVSSGQANAAVGAAVNGSATLNVAPGQTNGSIGGGVKAMRADDKTQLQGERTDFKGNMEIKRDAVKDSAPEDRPALRQGMQDDRDAFKGEMQDQRQGMMLDLRGMIATNLMRRADNHAQISARIKTRIAKIKATGKVDTSTATALVIQADASIALAKIDAAKVKADVDAKATAEVIKTDIQATIADLKAANGYLQQAVNDLKAKVGTPKGNAGGNTSTTVETNTSTTTQ